MSSGRRGRDRLAALGIAALALAVHAPALGNGFVNFDDNLYVTENRFVLRGLSADGVAWALTSLEFGNWHPLTWLSHMTDVTLFGQAAWGHHLSSLLLHALNAALLLRLLRTLTGALPAASLAAALFAVHPLQVESVAWIAERKNVLSATFVLAALLLYRRYAARPTAGRYLAVALAMSLAAAAKATAVTLPALLLLLDWWPLGRLGGAARPSRPPLRRVAAEKLPLLALSGAAALLAVRSQGTGILWEHTLKERFANTILSLAAYLRRTLWPADLAFYYPFPDRPPHPAAWISLLALLLAAGALAARVRRSRPWLAAGGLWFLVTLFPVAGLIQVGGQAMADRYLYLPVVGLFLAASCEALRVPPRWRPVPRGATALALAGLAAATVLQVGTWRDSETLMRRAIAVTDRNDVAHNNLGAILLERGDFAGAAREFRTVLEISPRDALAHFNLGLVLSRLGDDRAAAEHLGQGLRTEPDPRALDALAAVLERLGRAAEAEARRREASALRAARPGSGGAGLRE